MTRPSPAVDPLMLDARELSCVQVLLLIRARIVDLPPESLLTVATDDPAAPLDLPAWCHLTGHHYLGPVASPLVLPTASGSPRTRRRWIPDARGPLGLDRANGLPPLGQLEVTPRRRARAGCPRNPFTAWPCARRGRAGR
jgi:tRNA 2-thiouridine synthesizing protein A